MPQPITEVVSLIPPLEADRKRHHINYKEEEEEEEEEEKKDDQIVALCGCKQMKEGIVDPPDNCNSLMSGTLPSSTKLDAEELASRTHSSATEPYNN